jgi:CyaY protein
MSGSQPLTESEYTAFAATELHALLAALDSLGDTLEAELAGDILTIEFADDKTYVVNSHTAARQIWMAAERQAWHFDYDRGSGRWVAHKSGDELWSTLERLLSSGLGTALKLPRG